jgi:hypothetical protein
VGAGEAYKISHFVVEKVLLVLERLRSADVFQQKMRERLRMLGYVYVCHATND